MIRYLTRSWLKYPWMIRLKLFRPSLDRLRELEQEASRQERPLELISEEFSRILHDLTICGVWRWTGRHRLEGMDRLLSGYALSQGWKHFHMLDVGASDGITALDTVEYVWLKNQISIRVTIVDRNTRLFCARNKFRVVYFTSSGEPILVRYGRFALCLEHMEGLEGVLFNRLALFLSRRQASAWQGRGADSISLVNPAVIRCPSIDVCESDLFCANEKWFGAYDAVRASNVLNFSYYTESQIAAAIKVLYQYLKEDGLLLVSRNLIGVGGEKEKGAVWRKKQGRFVSISSLEERPEIAGIVDGFAFKEERRV